MYPESPPPLAPLGLPLRGFDELQFDSASERRDDDDTNMIIETTLDAGHDIEETHADTDWYTVTNLIQAGPIAAVDDAQPASEPDVPPTLSTPPSSPQDRHTPNEDTIKDHMETAADGWNLTSDAAAWRLPPTNDTNNGVPTPPNEPDPLQRAGRRRALPTTYPTSLSWGLSANSSRSLTTTTTLLNTLAASARTSDAFVTAGKLTCLVSYRFAS